MTTTPIKIISFTILLFITINIANGQAQPNQSTLVFYLQDIGKGHKATVLPVIDINGKRKSLLKLVHKTTKIQPYIICAITCSKTASYNKQKSAQNNPAT
ncbi:hypothetical protein RYX36_037075 [Vicia faba]